MSHCTLPRLAAVDLIGHLELYEFFLMSNQYGRAVVAWPGNYLVRPSPVFL